MARIEVQDISFHYEGHNGTRTALSHVSLAVEDGEFVCLVGRSGCGKPPLLRLLAGLQSPASGQILLDGKPITGPGTDRAVVFQNYALFPWMTARKNVEFGIRQANRTLSRSAIRESSSSLWEMKIMPFPSFLNLSVSSISFSTSRSASAEVGSSITRIFIS